MVRVDATLEAVVGRDRLVVITALAAVIASLQENLDNKIQVSAT